MSFARAKLAFFGRGQGQGPAPSDPPIFTVAPVASGSNVVDGILTCDGGTVTGSGVVRTYQWESDGVPLEGATEASHKVRPGEQFRQPTCVVTATNTGGSVESTTAQIGRTPIDFGVKTRSGAGGFPVGAAPAASITGTGASDWVIDDRGHLTRAGTYNAYKAPTSDVTLTIAGITGAVPVRMLANTAHVREMLRDTEGGETTVNYDTSSRDQLRGVFNNAQASAGALVGGDVVLGRSSPYVLNDRVAVNWLYGSTDGYGVGDGTNIILRSEEINYGADVDGNPRRGGGFKLGKFYYAMSAIPWPLTVEHVTFYSNYSALANSSKMLSPQNAAAPGGIQPRFCHFELGPDVPSSARTSFVGAVETGVSVPVTSEYNHFENLGRAHSIKCDGFVSQLNVFKGLCEDAHQAVNVDNTTIWKNWAFFATPPEGAHPDYAQISNVFSVPVPIDGLIFHLNLLYRSGGIPERDDMILGLISAWTGALFTGGEFTNNVSVQSQANGLRLGRMFEPTIKFNTLLHDPHSTESAGQGGATSIYREAGNTDGATGGVLAYNTANAFSNWVDQIGMTTTPNRTISTLTAAAYQAAGYVNFPLTQPAVPAKTVFDFLEMVTPGVAALDGSNLCYDALFPAAPGETIGSVNDGTAFDPGNPTWLAAHPPASTLFPRPIPIPA